jgi:hypothetical protein
MINNILNWGKRLMSKKNVDPVFSVAELRAELERIAERARNAGLRHYLIESALQDAAMAIRMKYAATSPL